jgi:hypothetical protein
MSNENFVSQASEFVQDIGILRRKLDTKLGQMCKKISNMSVATSANTIIKSDKSMNAHVAQADSDTIQLFVEESVQEIPETDPDKGTHIGSGFWLKREGHLIKMTSPEWVVYY